MSDNRIRGTLVTVTHLAVQVNKKKSSELLSENGNLIISG